MIKKIWTAWKVAFVLTIDFQKFLIYENGWCVGSLFLLGTPTFLIMLWFVILCSNIDLEEKE